MASVEPNRERALRAYYGVASGPLVGVEQPPSRSPRVCDNAGIDPVSKKRRDPVEAVPAGPSAARDPGRGAYAAAEPAAESVTRGRRAGDDPPQQTPESRRRTGSPTLSPARPITISSLCGLPRVQSASLVLRVGPTRGPKTARRDRACPCVGAWRGLDDAGRAAGGQVMRAARH